jgi:RNA polymerase sigma-70 factor (ECF subfamily)
MPHSVIPRELLLDEPWFYNQYRIIRPEFLSWSTFSYNLTNEDAKDLYQEVFLIFWKNIHEGRLTELTCEPKTYVFSIGKHLILNFIKKNKRTVTFSDPELIKAIDNPWTMEHDRAHNRRFVKDILQQLPEKDRRVLELYYMEEKDMRTIAAELGYKNADVAKKKKYEVFRKLCSLVNPSLKIQPA